MSLIVLWSSSTSGLILSYLLKLANSYPSTSSRNSVCNKCAFNFLMAFDSSDYTADISALLGLRFFCSIYICYVRELSHRFSTPQAMQQYPMAKMNLSPSESAESIQVTTQYCSFSYPLKAPIFQRFLSFIYRFY